MIISWNFRENTKYYANTVFCTSAFSIPILEENNGIYLGSPFKIKFRSV